MVLKKVNLSITELSNKNNNPGEFVMLNTNRNLKKSGRSFFMSKIFRHLSNAYSKRDFFNVKKAFYSLAVLGFLATIVSCGCENPVAPTPSATNVNPSNTVTVSTNGTDIRIDRNIIFYPENTVSYRIPVDINILSLINLDSNFTSNDVFITVTTGLDAVANLNGLRLDGQTISGDFKLNQRLNFEKPTDTDRDNDYEIVNYNILVSNFISNVVSSFNTNFKLILRIYDLAAEPSKLEILIDSFHLSLNPELRGIKELYLYESAFVADPTAGNDPNNVLLPSLIANNIPIGTSHPSSDITKLYDKNDAEDAFLTAINNSSNAYHRVTFNFITEVNLQKIAIRGRRAGGYQGFYFIIRDVSSNILSVHQATGSAARGSGSDATAVSTYSFVPTYANPITNVGIRMENSFFDIAENTTNVILIDNFSVMTGYEYERGFVSFDGLGADFSRFNTENVYFINNGIFGLSFIDAPDAEATNDADANNLYEVGTVTISNIDGGQTNFNLTVKVVNVPSTAVLLTNAVSYTVRTDQPIIISNLADLVDQDTLTNAINLGLGTFDYQLGGVDSNYFRVIGNVLQTAAPSGFDPFGQRGYDVIVSYFPENGEPASNLSVTVQIGDVLNKITGEAPWASRGDFQSVVLSDGTILVIGGNGNGPRDGVNLLPHIWGSRDGGNTWYLVSEESVNRLQALSKGAFQALVLPNDDILVMGGYTVRFSAGSFYGPGVITNGIWLSQDGGVNWQDISPASGHWKPRFGFQAVLLQNGDILVMGGRHLQGSTENSTNDIWRSSDGGRTWSLVTASAPWPSRSHFQALVLENGNILVMAGHALSSTFRKDIWISSDGGLTWSQIIEINNSGSHYAWRLRHSFQALALPNNRIVLMGGLARRTFENYYENFPETSLNDIIMSTNNGTNWNRIKNAFLPRITKSEFWEIVREPTTPFPFPSTEWRDRYKFQSVITKNNEILIMGGQHFRPPIRYDGGLILGHAIEGVLNDVWRIGPVDPNQP